MNDIEYLIEKIAKDYHHVSKRAITEIVTQTIENFGYPDIPDFESLDENIDQEGDIVDESDIGDFEIQISLFQLFVDGELVRDILDEHPEIATKTKKEIMLLALEGYQAKIDPDLRGQNHDLHYRPTYVEDLLMNSLGANELYSIYTPTSFADELWFAKIIDLAILDALVGRIVIMPIYFNENHWAGMVVRPIDGGEVQLIYIDPSGAGLDAPNLYPVLVEGFGRNNFIESTISQLENEYDTGPLTVSNLFRIATTRDNINNSQDLATLLSMSPHIDAGALRAIHDRSLHYQPQEYSASDIESLLNHNLEGPYYVSDAISLNSINLFGDIDLAIYYSSGEQSFGSTVFPIFLPNNHWAGLVIRPAENGGTQSIYVDPSGNGLGESLLRTLLTQTLPRNSFVELRINQLHNENDSGAFTVANLLDLVLPTNIPNNAQGIIDSGILVENLGTLRDAYDTVLHPVSAEGPRTPAARADNMYIPPAQNNSEASLDFLDLQSMNNFNILDQSFYPVGGNSLDTIDEPNYTQRPNSSLRNLQDEFEMDFLGFKHSEKVHY